MVAAELRHMNNAAIMRRSSTRVCPRFAKQVHFTIFAIDAGRPNRWSIIASIRASLEVQMPAGRFDNILKGAPSAAVYDTVLWDLGEVVVTPTLGSIIPHWVLAIPRDPAVNIARWSKDPQEPLHLISQIASVAGYKLDQILWFEHGAPSIGAVTGCGVDHAHLHLLLQPPFSFEEFKAASRAAALIDWQEGNGNPYETLRPDASYLVAGSSKRYFLAKDTDSVGSQFFRRIVASLAGVPNYWDYKRYSHLQNVKATLAHAKAA